MISSIVNPLFFFLNLSNNPMNNPFHINKTFSTDSIIASVKTHITGKNFSRFPFLAFWQSKLGRHFFLFSYEHKPEKQLLSNFFEFILTSIDHTKYFLTIFIIFSFFILSAIFKTLQFLTYSFE